MSTSINIPRTQAAIQTDLKSLWLTENELHWHRAALVYAWVDLALDDPQIHSEAEAFTALAKQKVQGLGASSVTVKSYYLAWQSAINIGVAQPIAVGTSIELPSDSFGNHWKETPKAKQDARAKARQDERKNIKVITDAKPVAPQPKPKTEKKPFESATVPERGERIIRELELQVKMETDDGLRVLWDSALALAKSAVGQYQKALSR